MSFFFLKNNSINEAECVGKKSIQEMGFQENQIRDLVAKQIGSFFPGLKTISTEFSPWEDSSRRLDILAMDSKSNLVVIELKRDKDGAHAELQALRYAAMLSVCTFENILAEGLKYRKDSTPTEVETEFRVFLNKGPDENVEFSSIPKIILISSEFKKEITTTVMWLNETFALSGMDIACYEINLYELQGGHGLHFDQIIPIAAAQEYQIRAKKKLEAAKQAANKQPFSVPLLEKFNLLTPGSEVVLTEKLHKSFDVENADQKSATYLGGGKFKWKYDGNEYSSLNALTKEIFTHHGREMSSLQCPDYWSRVGQSLSLAKEAKQAHIKADAGM